MKKSSEGNETNGYDTCDLQEYEKQKHMDETERLGVENVNHFLQE